MAKKRDPYIDRVFFNDPSGATLDVAADGTVTVRGTWSGQDQLVRIYAAVVHGDVSEVKPHPWCDHPDFPPTEGQVDPNGPNTWSCRPGVARGRCLPDTVYAWGFFVGTGPIGVKNLLFLGDSTGSGCSGSGSGSGSPPAITKLSQQIMPRFYQISPDVESISLSSAGKNFLGGVGLIGEGIVVEYDEDHSTPEEMIWRSLDLSPSGTKWALRVTQGAMRLEASVTMQRSSETQVKSPFVWQCSRWNVNSKNVLKSDLATFGFDLPNLHVEPIQ